VSLSTPGGRNLVNRKLWAVYLPMAVYAFVLVTSMRFVHAHPESPWKMAVALSPVVPIAFVVGAGIQRIRGMDEFQQRMHLEVLAFAYPTMVVGSISYGFLQWAGLPAVNWMYVGVCMMILFLLGRIVWWWRYR
jgi:hypothetical protein